MFERKMLELTSACKTIVLINTDVHLLSTCLIPVPIKLGRAEINV